MFVVARSVFSSADSVCPLVIWLGGDEHTESFLTCEHDKQNLSVKVHLLTPQARDPLPGLQ